MYPAISPLWGSSPACVSFLLKSTNNLVHRVLSVGPLVTSEKARAGELDISLLERLFERPLYADHVQARSRMQKVALHAEPPTFIPFTNLVKVCQSLVSMLFTYSRCLELSKSSCHIDAAFCDVLRRLAGAVCY